MARASAKKKAIATAPKAVVKIEDKQSSRPLANVQEDPFLIAFYLPQYHPIPENDKWWGKGFTEWSNVAKGQPQFEGHYQPHVPSDLGFYDLRMGEIQKEQARLAKAHGVDAFCYYYYWFSGKKLLEKPLENMLASDSDFPFCICWANENWTRRWDGMDDDILIEQKYRKEDPELFAKEVAPILKDERYIRVQGKPLFIVYKATDIPNLQDTLKLWRKVWQNEGIDEVQICAVMTQPEHDLTSFGIDAMIEFPPLQYDLSHVETEELEDMSEEFGGKLYDYNEIVSLSLTRKLPSFPLYRGVMPSWDNTARRKNNGYIFLDSSPEAYESWLATIVEETRHRLEPGNRLLFINAWNEWAEGAHLEPDQKYGHAYLEATKRAKQGDVPVDKQAALVLASDIPLPEPVSKLIDRYQKELEIRDRTIQSLLKLVKDRYGFNELLDSLSFMPGWPGFIQSLPQMHRIAFHIDIFHKPDNRTNLVQVKNQELLHLRGWLFSENIAAKVEDPYRAAILQNIETKQTFHALIWGGFERSDVVQIFRECTPETVCLAGFDARFNLAGLPKGQYKLALAVYDTQKYVIGWTNKVLQIL